MIIEPEYLLLEVLVKGLLLGDDLRSLGLPLFFKAICINNNLKNIFFNIMQNSGFAGENRKNYAVLLFKM